MVMKERIQKILSKKGICSRRKAETLLRQERIYVNGHLAIIGDKVDLENEELDSGNNKSKTVTQNFNSAETFHDEDLTGTLDIIDEDIDISREIELIDEDY